MGQIRQYMRDGRPLKCTAIQVLDNHVLRYVPPEQLDRFPSVLEWRPHWLQHRKFGLLFVGACSADPANVLF